VTANKYDDPLQLLDSLRIETTIQGRDDIVLAALSQGISPRAIELVLDQIEAESQTVKQRSAVPRPNFLGRMYWYFFQRHGRRNADLT
jgi:hypothetical protein